MRNRLYDNLPLVPNLSQLNLGPGSYGYTPDLFRYLAPGSIVSTLEIFFCRTCFLAGLVDMRRLTHFTLQFDCFDQLIEVEQAFGENVQQMIRGNYRM